MSEPSLEQAAAAAQALRDEVDKVFIGHAEVVDQVLIALFAGGHVLIEGVPGLGKTLLVLAISKAVGGEFSRVQFTPDLMPSDVTGHAMFDQTSEQFTIRRGPVFSNFLLVDEVNRAPAKTQSALLEVMQEGQVTIEGESFPLAPPFMALATQNPIEQEGTYPLPEAQLDRFLLKIVTSYPSNEEEVRIVRLVTEGRVGNSLDVAAVERVLDLETVLGIQRRVAQTLADERIVEYAVRIARETRARRGIMVGAGPRGAIALVRAARAAAILDGREYVTPDDLRTVAAPALRHRIILAPEMELEGVSADAMLASILDSVDAPRA